jgi:murein tripeptide amidase MpaA
MARAQTPPLAQPTAPDRFNPENFLPRPPAWSGASERLIAAADDPWITPSERTGLTATPSYDETVAWLRRLDQASNLIHIEQIGTTPQGRRLIAVIASKDGAVLNRNKPVFLIQAGIHSGEIDGKDAGLMLLRDICFHNRADLIDKVNIVFVPVLNADGHERSTPYSRPNQRGPINMGWRNTGQNINLNRDYLKADGPEMRSLLGLLTKYDPSLYIDLHVTDGMDYQYDVTYSFDGWDGRYADSPAIGRWLDTVYRPFADRQLSAAGHIPGPMIFARDESDLSKGLDFNAFAPRFSHAYGDLRRLPTVLVENHSLKPYRQRVLGTYVLLEASLKLLAEKGADLKAAIAADRALRPATVDANWKPVEAPMGQVDFLTMQYERVASAATGGQVLHWTGAKGPTVRTPVYGSEPGIHLPIAKVYWVPRSRPDVIERLKAHGVVMETTRVARTVNVDMIRIQGPRVGAPSEGRYRVTASGYAHETRGETFPAGSVRISTDQPLGALVATLLEPESEDSFFQWGFFPEILQRVEYMEAYAMAPLADSMLAADPALKAEFEARLRADPEFAGSEYRRLSFFYERSPFYDQRYLLYPIGREP